MKPVYAMHGVAFLRDDSAVRIRVSTAAEHADVLARMESSEDIRDRDAALSLRGAARVTGLGVITIDGGSAKLRLLAEACMRAAARIDLADEVRSGHTAVDEETPSPEQAEADQNEVGGL